MVHVPHILLRIWNIWLAWLKIQENHQEKKQQIKNVSDKLLITQKRRQFKQVHRITNSIKGALEDKDICSTISLVLAQVFESDPKGIRTGVPQASVSGSIIYSLPKNDSPEIENVTIPTFADDAAVLAVDSNLPESSSKPHQASNNL
ncbi:hypothetical protein JTB14_004296 [Gonioctena quinquepunctata]|nr:hypothetical protein JTB14_004296 [Gonioctena quinquepunctata]